MSVCKFNQRGFCRFGDSCKNLHQRTLVTVPAHNSVTEAPCIFFARGECIRGGTCNFAHLVGNEPQSPTATAPRHANSTNRCKYWIKGTCKKGKVCPFIHSEVTISPTCDDHNESPASTPTLTLHTPIADSDEVREIDTLGVETAEPEIHMLNASWGPEGMTQDSQQPFSGDPKSDTALISFPKSTPLPLEIDSDISSHLVTSDECKTENHQGDARTLDASIHLSPISSSLEISNEDSKQGAPLEDMENTPLNSSLNNMTSEEYGEEKKPASADRAFFPGADTCPDGNICGFNHLMPENQLTIPPDLTVLASDSSSGDEIDNNEQPVSPFVQDNTNTYGLDRSYEPATEGVEQSASIQQSPPYLEAKEVMPVLMQNSTNAPQSDPSPLQNVDMESEGQAIHPFLASSEAPEDVPHWSQYADPHADPTIPFCKFFAQARCTQGYACSFRHSITANEYALLFRDPQPPLWNSGTQLLRAGCAVPSAVSTFGICKFYPLGTCRNGDACTYLHAPAPIFMSTDSEPMEGWVAYNEPAIPPHPGWESRPCRYYAETGYCRNGDECQFHHVAHAQSPEGMRDGQDDGRNTRYNDGTGERVTWRARPCKYSRGANCWKGDKCTFLHDNANAEEEHKDGWEETISNGWHEGADGWDTAADGWGAPNAEGWGEPKNDGEVPAADKDVDKDEGMSMAGGAIDDVLLSKQSAVDGLAEAKSCLMEDKRPINDKTAQSAPRTTRASNLCRFYNRGRCNWGIRCADRHDGPDNETPDDTRGETTETRWDVPLQAPEDQCQDQVEDNALAKDPWDDPLQADEPHYEPIIPVDIGDSWGEVSETPWDVPVQVDKPSQTRLASDLSSENNGLRQSDDTGNDVAASNIHKWALTVADEGVESQSLDDEKTWSIPWSDNVAEPTTPVRIRAPCKAFGQGFCNKGDSCRYLHITPPDPLSEAQRLAVAEGSVTGTEVGDQTESDTEIAISDVDRNMFNCTVCFGSGCSPTNVLTACESSRVLLINLSPIVTYDDLRDIANLFGFVSDIVINPGEASANAAVEFGDPAQALDAVTHLDGQTYDSAIIEARLDTAATERTMQPLISRMIKVSWPPPTLSAWAFYSTITTAKKQEKRLDGWAFNGLKIKAEFYRPRPKQTHSFAVKITDLPAKINKQSLEKLCEESTLVSLEPVTYDSSPVNNAIRGLLAGLGPLESFDVRSWDDDQPEVVGFAQFCMDGTPLEGVMALNTVPQTFLGGGSLSMQQVFHAKYNLSDRQLHAVRDEVVRLEGVRKPHCNVRFYESAGQGKPVLHVYGDFKEPDKFGHFNIELQALFQGEILMSEGKRVWDEYFDISSSAKALEKINADSTFFIQVDNRTQAIHVVGTESSRHIAQATVSRLLKKVRAQRCVIPLDRFSLHGLLTGGYRVLQDSVGINKVTLDVVASELIVRGESDIVRQVRLAMNSYAPISSNDSSEPDLVERGRSCPVCCQNPTNPIKLSCRHAYCQTCLQHVLQISAGLRFTPLRCIAAMMNEENEQGQQCIGNIPYTVVRDLLRADEEERLLKSSFLCHVRNNPDEYFFCPTPNCETVYGHGREGVAYRCPLCSTQVCSSCHLQYHEGLTCSKRREIWAITTS